ncbi:MAG: hypothetical protein QT03_C0001G1291 [archaeon GW2011_AR10]|uniref:S-layer protein n=1 Tax=Candidatus Iainarchaeum sp. TaxID=3101447 RepID=A0A7J4IRN1_9ARCH|nr:MAG: hypothetical protein QT03_C0001G1291 [archaeon GW2011_AR10]HIH08092.1 S-layer protein [Candidatus Diapherotrites archaeon]
MKGLSIKKLAAVATGAALVGTALAPIVSALDLQKSDVFNNNGTPKVSIVVGSEAAISDAVWGGNLAAAIAEQARSYKSVSVSGEAGDSGSSTPSVSEISVDLTVGGTVTYANAKTYKAGETSQTVDLNSYSGAKEFPGLLLTDSVLENLVNKSVTIKWNGTNYTRTFKEEIGVTADTAFDYSGGGDVADLETYLSNENDINYALNLGSGVPVYETTSTTNTFTDGTNDNVKIPLFGEDYLVRTFDKANNHMRLIKEQDKLTFSEGDTITGLKGRNELAGQDVSVKVTEVTAPGPAAASYKAKFALVDANGTEVNVYEAATGESLDEQFVGSDGELALETILYIDTISVGASSGVGAIDVTIGTTLVDLYHLKGYPYDSSNTTGIYDYKVTFQYSTDGNWLAKIIIGNSDQKWTNSSANNDPLYAPSAQALTSTGQAGTNEVSFLGTEADGTLGKNYFTVSFDGLETDEPLHQIKVTDNALAFTDASDRTHTVFFYKRLSKSTSGSSFSFDGKTIYYASFDGTVQQTIGPTISADGNKLNGTGVFRSIGQDAGGTNITFGNGDVITGLAVNAFIDINGFYYKISAINSDENDITLQGDGNIVFAKTPVTTSQAASSTSDYLEADANKYTIIFADQNTADRRAYRGNTISLQGNDDVVFQYALMADQSTGEDLYLLLDSSTTFNGRYDADLQFKGTDLGEDGVVDGTEPPHNTIVGDDRLYYWPDESSDFGGGSNNDYYIATFAVETGGSTSTAADATADWDTNFFIDTEADELPSFPNTNLSGYSEDLNYNRGNIDGAVAFGMDEYDATKSKPDNAYNDVGTKFEIEGLELTITVPDNPKRAILVVKTEGTTTSTTGGEELTIAEGESGTTSGGTTITISTVNYTASCAAGEGETGTCAADPENYFEPAAVPEQMVYLDTESPSGKLILVGGHFVNRMSANVSNIRDLLTSAGDGRDPWVDEATGNIVVAGYTADDTVAAARQLIRDIEAIDMMA